MNCNLFNCIIYNSCGLKRIEVNVCVLKEVSAGAFGGKRKSTSDRTCWTPKYDIYANYCIELYALYI